VRQVSCGIDRVNGIIGRLEQLNFPRSGWCDCHNSVFLLDRSPPNARAS
jgi:hypothetical protein